MPSRLMLYLLKEEKKSKEKGKKSPRPRGDSDLPKDTQLLSGTSRFFLLGWLFVLIVQVPGDRSQATGPASQEF